MGNFKKKALDYHKYPIPGKITIEISKSSTTVEDLSLAYSPGVAEPTLEIYKNPENAYQYTGKGNLVAVISNGSAILGLGNLGALASKPVMEGKALLFKKFSNINAIDIEVDTQDTQSFIQTVKNIAPSFGGINLEDIKAPECFEIEEALIKACNIPVFHDDQHGTAIITAAALFNALELTNKKLDQIKLVCMGAGAAAISCCDLLLHLGLQSNNLFVLDSQGLLQAQRSNLNQHKQRFAYHKEPQALSDIMKNADVFLGLAGPNLLDAALLKIMAPNPIVFACSNPTPEIMPELAHTTRSDIIMATGRSDYPNQVNNVLAFPFIFRGALDVRATCINQPMKIAAIKALQKLAKEPIPDSIRAAYHHEDLVFGPQYIIPKPLDPRLLTRVSSAVAEAAIQSGVARIASIDEYNVSIQNK
ncbi:MAG: malate dehydrogenase [Endozoicomonadaceae bacterium]|nr:malate dehydrogenase [Endozoicomonadaceae bacterium]